MGAVLVICALVSSHKMCDKFPHFGGAEQVNFPSTIYHFHSLLQIKTKAEETQKPYRGNSKKLIDFFICTTEHSVNLLFEFFVVENLYSN